MAALAVLALTLRVACATVTEVNPLFPAYYYTDAARIHSYASAALSDLQAGRPPLINGALGERLQTAISLGVYRLFGPSPFLIKLLNASLGAAAVAAFVWALSMAFPFRSAFAAGILLAAWPSHVFYTSQNLKEAPVSLLAYAALGAALASGFDTKSSRARAASFALAAAAGLLAAGFYRSYVLLCLGTACLAALALSLFSPPRSNALLASAAILASFALYPSASRGLLHSFHSEALGAADQGRIQPRLIPVTYDNFDPGTLNRPTSPEGLTGFRRTRQSADRIWAAAHGDREIGTQIYPEAAFKSWLDVAAYLPKGAFTVLFMPLPGLYPLDGKPGRWAAAGENTLLLAIALLASTGFIRGRKTPARAGLLLFFASMTVGSALLEFDLGSAGRHKLLYLPVLFPFAAEEAFRLIGRDRA